MATYYVDDGGDNSDGLTWAKAYNSLADLDDAVTIVSGDIIYIGSDSVDAFAYGAARIFTGPASGLPATLISATVGTTTYAVATANHIDTIQAGAFNITFNGSWSIYGCRIVSGGDITISNASNTTIGFCENCEFRLGGQTKSVSFGTNGKYVLRGITFNLVADAAPSAFAVLTCNGHLSITDFIITNGSNRTGNLFTMGVSARFVSVNGGDVTSCTNATTPEIAGASSSNGYMIISNVLTAATFLPLDTASTYLAAEITLVNVGPADQPTALTFGNSLGRIDSKTTIYRTGGATVNGTAMSWGGVTNGLQTSGGTSLDSPFFTPWLYGEIASTGTYAFTVYIVNDTFDFNDDEVWLEVQYKDDASSGEWTQATDRIATRTTTPAAQTVDGTSAWNGSGPSFTYKQSLVVSGLTVDTTGQFRVRVGIGVVSIPAARHFYIDPKVTVA